MKIKMKKGRKNIYATTKDNHPSVRHERKEKRIISDSMKNSYFSAIQLLQFSLPVGKLLAAPMF